MTFALPFAQTRWDEIIPGLWQGGHDYDDGGVYGPVIVADEFDLVVSLFHRQGHGPSAGIEERRALIPDDELSAENLGKVTALVPRVVAALRDGKRVFVRCQAGYNRSGLVVALTLLALGYTADDAIALIRRRRSRYALCNPAFVGYIRDAAHVGTLRVSQNPGQPGDGWYAPTGPWGLYGAAGILLRHVDRSGTERYLMTRRGPGVSDPGMWQFPGGALASNESPAECAMREAAEELGLTERSLAGARVHGRHEATASGAAGWKYTSFAATVPTRVRPDLSSPQVRAETAAAKWLTLSQIRVLDAAGKLLKPLSGGALERNVIGLFPPSSAEPTEGTVMPPATKTPQAKTRAKAAPLACIRHYRVVAADTYLPGWPANARVGQLRAERAERQLRARLAAGEVPDVLLVGPESNAPAEIGRSGRVTDVWAWGTRLHGGEYSNLQENWTNNPHVTAELTVTRHEGDPMCPIYAAAGSIRVLTGRVQRLKVPIWLAPVSSALTARYGVPVDVDITPELPPAPALGSKWMVFPQVVPNLIIDRIAAIPRKPRDLRRDYEDNFRDRLLRADLPWHEWGNLVSDMLAVVAKTFQLPVNFGQGGVLEYSAGSSFPEHTDRSQDEVDSWDRTVSLTLMLSEPGEDFTGGEFEIDGEPIELHRGDVVGFTSVTPHAVREVTSGRRLILLGLGSYWR